MIGANEIEMLKNRYTQTTPLPKEVALAMAYVPFQQFGALYDDAKALDAGTLFCDLNKPFTGKVNVYE